MHHLHVEEGEDQVNPERHDDHFQGGEGEDQIQLSPEKLVDHLHTEEGKLRKSWEVGKRKCLERSEN